MRKMSLLAAAIVFATAGATQAFAAETWKGTISDSACGLKHSADKHGDKASDHRACVEKCVAGGGQYVFLTGGKVLKISNQDFKDLKVHAAHEVSLTGEIKDGAIVVSKIEVPKPEKK